MQSTKGRGYKKRFSSWYDPQLLTAAGEELLAKVDGNAIQELKRHQLVWQSWLFNKPNFTPLGPAFPNHSIRRVKFKAPSDLHRFFLSIAWRAGASNLPDMKDASVSAEHLELLRKALVSDEKIPADFFPVALTQLSTKGTIHNQTPYTDTLPKPPFSPNLYEEGGMMVRIYFDGLVSHVHLNPSAPYAIGNPAFIGGSDTVIVPGVTYEASFQYENLLFIAAETPEPFGQ